MNTFTRKKIEAGILCDMYDWLESRKKGLLQNYDVIGKEEEQATDWRTSELLWEDEEHTIPKYRDKYGYVDIPEDELSSEAKCELAIIDDLEQKLEKL